MTGDTALRKGWCPGARRPMQAKDGLLVRLRISGGVVPAATMRGIAQAGRAHGNGLFDLSARANLQMRGVRGESMPLLIEKFKINLARRFAAKQQHAILDVALDLKKLETMPVHEFVDMMTV